MWTALFLWEWLRPKEATSLHRQWDYVLSFELYLSFTIWKSSCTTQFLHDGLKLAASMFSHGHLTSRIIQFILTAYHRWVSAEPNVRIAAEEFASKVVSCIIYQPISWIFWLYNKVPMSLEKLLPREVPLFLSFICIQLVSSNGCL